MKKADMQKLIDRMTEERQKFISQFEQIRSAIGVTINMDVKHDGIAPDAVVRNILENKNLINSAPELLEACKAIVFYQEFYEANTGEEFPGNDFYRTEPMNMIAKSKSAIAKAEAKP